MVLLKSNVTASICCLLDIKSLRQVIDNGDQLFLTRTVFSEAVLLTRENDICLNNVDNLSVNDVL